MTTPDRELLDKIATEADHAETTGDVDLPYRRRASKTSPVYGLRLPAERIEQLRQIAQARGVEPSVLARQWVIDHSMSSNTPETKRRNDGNATCAPLLSTYASSSTSAPELVFRYNSKTGPHSPR